MKIIAEGIALLALLLVAGMLGYGYRGDRNQTAIAEAKSEAAVYQSALKSKGDAFDALKAQLDDLAKRHKAALAAATAALEARDAQIAALQADSQKRSTTIKESAHADADCAALDRMPVCAAIAGQLWPAAAAPADAADHAH